VTTTTPPHGVDGPTVYRITALELRLLAREPAMIVGLLAFPAITVLILAGVFGSGMHRGFGSVSPDDHYIVGYVGVVLAYVGLVALPVQIASRRELGFTRRYRASGVSAATLLLSNAVMGVLIAVTSGVIVVLFGGFAYGIQAPEHPLTVAAWLAAGVACFVVLGIALGVLMPSSRAANAFGNLIFVPMFLLGGGGPPREVMTGTMQRLSDALPLSHIIGGLRTEWLGADGEPTALWWSAAVTLAAAIFAILAARSRRAT
jgi:ABC-2 type transport system permease protein